MLLGTEPRAWCGPALVSGYAGSLRAKSQGWPALTCLQVGYPLTLQEPDKKAFSSCDICMEADKQQIMPPEAVAGDQGISYSSRPTCERTCTHHWTMAGCQESPDPWLTAGTLTFRCL